MNQIIDYKSRPKRKSKTTLFTETQKTIKALIVTLSVMIVALSAFFLFSTSENAQKGYILQQQKIRNEDLKSQNATITAKINQSTAGNKLEETAKIKEMQELENKTYITNEDNRIK